jgi:hypothetical protein
VFKPVPIFKSRIDGKLEEKNPTNFRNGWKYVLQEKCLFNWWPHFVFLFYELKSYFCAIQIDTKTSKTLRNCAHAVLKGQKQVKP